MNPYVKTYLKNLGIWLVILTAIAGTLVGPALYPEQSKVVFGVLAAILLVFGVPLAWMAGSTKRDDPYYGP
jgi:hypothetical protein